MVSEVLVVLLFPFERDRRILMVKDYAWKRNKLLYTKMKVSAFSNFEVEEEKIEKSTI